MTRDGTFTVLGKGTVPGGGGGGWWGQCGAQRAELRDERAPVAPVPQQQGPELKAASYFTARPKPCGAAGAAVGPAASSAVVAHPRAWARAPTAARWLRSAGG